MQFPALSDPVENQGPNNNPRLYQDPGNLDKVIRVWNITNDDIKNRALIDAVLSKGLRHTGLIQPDLVAYRKVNGADPQLALKKTKGEPVKDILLASSWNLLRDMLLDLVCVVEGLHNLQIANLSLYPEDLVFLRSNAAQSLALSKFATRVELLGSRDQNEVVRRDLNHLVESLLELIAVALIKWIKQDQKEAQQGRISPRNQHDLRQATQALQRLSALFEDGQRFTIEQIKLALGNNARTCTPIQLNNDMKKLLQGEGRDVNVPISQQLAALSNLESLNELKSPTLARNVSSVSPIVSSNVSPSVSRNVSHRNVAERCQPCCEPGYHCVPDSSSPSSPSSSVSELLG